ncbi:hypothetical protein K474DRAFT_1208865 [Panus rudis PR-1116 ss-1]|nr:hypothetical protein K474DRAFT_1208865 [Panus rudis PR-1116 ss-1]
MTGFRPGILQLAALLWAASYAPTAQAVCYIDAFGFERCTLSTGARVGIAIALIALSFVIVALLTVGYRKRRMRQNMAFVQQNQGAGMDPQLQQPYYGQQNGYPSYPAYPQYSPGPGAPQYPPQTYSGAYPGYDPNAGFAPPTGAPPQYAPPPGPPPAQGKEAV